MGIISVRGINCCCHKKTQVLWEADRNILQQIKEAEYATGANWDQRYRRSKGFGRG